MNSKLLQMFRKNLDFLVVFVLGFGYALIDGLNVCKKIGGLGYDMQNFWLWEWVSVVGMKPFRDLLTPYGWLHFWKASQWWAYWSVTMMIGIMFVVIYSIFGRFFMTKKESLAAFLVFFYVVWMFEGPVSFWRYGMLLVWSMILPFVFCKPKKTMLFVGGLMLGALVWLMLGEGIYILAFTIGWLGVKSLVMVLEKVFEKRRNVFCELTKLIKNCLVFFLGVGLSLVALGLWLFTHDQLGAWWGSIRQFKYMSVYAKTSFDWVIDWEEMVGMGAVFLGVSVTTLHVFFTTRKMGLKTQVLTSLVLATLLMQQKNLMRGMGNHILMYAVCLMILLLGLVMIELKKLKINTCLVFWVFLFSIFGLFDRGYAVSYVRQGDGLSFLTENSGKKNGVCQKKDFLGDKFELANDQEEVLAKIKDESFVSWPGDPIFYILADQKPVYFPQSYETSSIENQLEYVRQVSTEERDVLVYRPNMANSDGVPDYVRNPLVVEYFLTNFLPNEQVGRYVLMKKNPDLDFFEQDDEGLNDFRNRFLNLDMGYLPASEGEHKLSQLRQAQVVVEWSSEEDLINWFEKNTLESTEKVVVIKNQVEKKSRSVLILETKKNFKTRASFSLDPKTEYYVFTLARVPLFYQERKIVKLVVEGGFEWVKIYQSEKDFGLW